MTRGFAGVFGGVFEDLFLGVWNEVDGGWIQGLDTVSNPTSDEKPSDMGHPVLWRTV